MVIATSTAPSMVRHMYRCMVCGVGGSVMVEPHAYAVWLAGGLVQDCFPDLSADDRELIITGTHPACFAKLFGPEDEGHDFLDDETQEVECAD